MTGRLVPAPMETGQSGAVTEQESQINAAGMARDRSDVQPTELDTVRA
jgi:hypothetical protein